MSEQTPVPDPSVPWSIEQAARRIGHYRWWEMRLFELVGGWARAVPEAEVAARLGGHSHHHAWRAELWGGLLPELEHLSEDRVVVAPGGLAELVEILDDGDTLDRLVGVHRVVLPRLIVAYRHHLDHTLAPTDGPLIRVLRLALTDTVDDAQEGERLLQGLLRTSADIEQAASRTRRIEDLVVAAGGICGPRTLG